MPFGSSIPDRIVPFQPRMLAFGSSSLRHYSQLRCSSIHQEHDASPLASGSPTPQRRHPRLRLALLLHPCNRSTPSSRRWLVPHLPTTPRPKARRRRCMELALTLYVEVILHVLTIHNDNIDRWLLFNHHCLPAASPEGRFCLFSSSLPPGGLCEAFE